MGGDDGRCEMAAISAQQNKGKQSSHRNSWGDSTLKDSPGKISDGDLLARLMKSRGTDLTVLAAIAGVVTKENCAEIAKWLRGKTLREVEAFAQRRQPGRAVRDQVRQIYVMRWCGAALAER